MRQNWDFYLLLLAVIAWAIYRARSVWQKEQERKAMLHEELEALEQEESERSEHGPRPGA